MNQQKCPDCGTMYPLESKSCPNCGCPNDNWVPPMPPVQSAPAVVNEPAVPHHVSAPVAEPKSDWANSFYECGASIWRTFSSKYASFNGRASRREYWSFTIFAHGLYAFVNYGWGLYMEGVFAHLRETSNGVMVAPGVGMLIASVVASIICLILFLPSLGVLIRRMHDVNKSGWWMFVPFADFFLLFKKSDEGENEYGVLED